MDYLLDPDESLDFRPPGDSSWMLLVSAPATVVSGDVLLGWQGGSVLTAYNGKDVIATFAIEKLEVFDSLQVSPNHDPGHIYLNGERLAEYLGPKFTIPGVGEDEVMAAAAANR